MHSRHHSHVNTLLAAIVIAVLGTACTSETAETTDEWIPLFNGEDLTGWTLKMTGQELGEDPWNTIRVEDGLLTVNYENYDDFEGRFGHLFYEEPFSHYELRVEYRFLDPQVPGAPEWAFKNNGVMIHSQSPQSMLRDQRFPISLEAQLLGGNGRGEIALIQLQGVGDGVEVVSVILQILT